MTILHCRCTFVTITGDYTLRPSKMHRPRGTGVSAKIVPVPEHRFSPLHTEVTSDCSTYDSSSYPAVAGPLIQGLDINDSSDDGNRGRMHTAPVQHIDTADCSATPAGHAEHSVTSEEPLIPPPSFSL